MKQFKLIGSLVVLVALLATGVVSNVYADKGPSRRGSSLVVGQVVHPVSLSYAPGSPSGVKQHQEYDLPAGEYQIQATVDGVNWQNVGAPLDFYKPYTAGFDIPLGGPQGNVGWRLVVVALGSESL